MAQTNLIDSFGRTIDYLRVSVTDRCNFRCVYCMPEEGLTVAPKSEILTAEELKNTLSVAAKLGIQKVRFTGGEPLLRKELEALVSHANSVGIEDLSLTTNGFGLKERLPGLKAAGLSRVNVSLDTLRPERFRSIARGGDFQRVWDGIQTAVDAGLAPVKLNVVALRGFNHDEAADFARITLAQPLHIRFIELMPIHWNLDGQTFDAMSAHPTRNLVKLRISEGGMLDGTSLQRAFIAAETVRNKIEAELGPMLPGHVVTNGPARTFRLPNAQGTVGFISQISDDLCLQCNRLRLTADGFLRGCLMSDGEIDLKSALRTGGDVEALIREAVRTKPQRHYLAEGQRAGGRSMSQIGG